MNAREQNILKLGKRAYDRGIRIKNEKTIIVINKESLPEQTTNGIIMYGRIPIGKFTSTTVPKPCQFDCLRWSSTYIQTKVTILNERHFKLCKNKERFYPCKKCF